MTDMATPAGFDLATVLTGSGVTLLISAGIVRYGGRFTFTPAELYGITGGVLVVLGLVIGLTLAAAGKR